MHVRGQPIKRDKSHYERKALMFGFDGSVGGFLRETCEWFWSYWSNKQIASDDYFLMICT